MKQLNQQDLQSVLDYYSVGRIKTIYDLAAVALKHNETIFNLNRSLIETNHGLYLLVFAPNDSVHELWWGSSLEKYRDKMSKSVGITNGELLANYSGAHTVHKYDCRFSLFCL